MIMVQPRDVTRRDPPATPTECHLSYVIDSMLNPDLRNIPRKCNTVVLKPKLRLSRTKLRYEC